MIYGTENQEDVAKKLCEQISRYEDCFDQLEFKREALLSLINAAVFLKDPVFKHEQEWRLVYFGGKAKPEAVNYQTGSRFLRPFVSGRFAKLPVESITIGPSDEQERLQMSMEHLIKMKDLGVQVKSSDIRLSGVKGTD